MYVNIAVLKETHPHERRVALVPSVVGKANQAGRAAHAVGRGRSRQPRRCVIQGCLFHGRSPRLVKDADVVLAVQPPAWT